jgi:aspartate/methionine/tyrosine aminotransferase
MADDVAIAAGGNLAFTMAMTVLAGEGEAVLLPAPWYFNHRMALAMLGITAIPLPCRAEDGFVPDPDRAAAQTALAWAVEGLRGWRAAKRALMAERAAAFRRAVAPLPGWRVDALGAYFAYLRLPDGAPGAEAAAERLAVAGGLLALPGPFFGPGQERHLRLAFANAGLEAIEAVPARLRAVLG